MDTVKPKSVSSSSDSSVTPAELRRLLGRADSPVVLDVRRLPRFQASTRLLPTARYCSPDQLPEFVASFATQQPSQPIVVYCVYGHEVSQDAAAWLRAQGWDARYVLGGMEGGEPGVDSEELLAELRTQGLPTIAKRPDLGVTGDMPSRWVTRERPKIDRIACPWLIRRFVDARAEFFYVPTPQVFEQAKALKAVAYDIPGAPITHDGALCSFDAVLKAFDLKLPALELLATIVRGADTDQLDLAPQSAGLLATSLGYSRLFSDDDSGMLEAMMPVYDALYAWCCDRVAAIDEQHSWKPQ